MESRRSLSARVSSATSAMGAAFLVLGLGVGCGKAREKVTGKLAEVAAEKALEPKGGDGAAAPAGADASRKEVTLPEGFPPSVPIYPDAVLSATGRNDAEGRRVYIVVFQTPDPGSKIAAYYKANLPGYSVASDAPLGKLHTVNLVDRNKEFDVILTMRPEGDHTSVQLAVGPMISAPAPSPSSPSP